MNKEYIQFAKDKFLIEDLLEDGKGLHILEEKDKGGESRLTVCCENEALYLCNCDKKNTDVGFFQSGKENCMKKRVDHIIFENIKDNDWKVHLIEMKSSVTGEDKWREIKGKFRASYLLVKMLAAVLELHISESIMYTTYGRVTLDKCKTDPAVRKAPMGCSVSNPKDEWDGGEFALNINGRRKFLHNPIKMMRDADGILVGDVTL